MDIQEIFSLFDEKVQELLKSNFSQNLPGSGVTIRWNKGEGFTPNLRRGPDYESIKNFVITFRNFILDSDPISIRNISKIYDSLPEKNDLRMRFQDAREKFNEFLDSLTIIRYNGVKISNRILIDTYIYGDVIHLEKHDEFKRWISVGPMKDIIFNEIVYVLETCGNFIYYFNNLNKEFLSNKPKDN